MGHALFLNFEKNTCFWRIWKTFSIIILLPGHFILYRQYTKKKKTTAIYCKTIVNIDQRKMPKVFDKQTFAVSCKNCRTVYTLLLQEKQNGKPLCLYIKKHEVCSCRLIVVLSNAARNDFLSFSQIKVKKPFPFHCQRS